MIADAPARASYTAAVSEERAPEGEGTDALSRARRFVRRHRTRLARLALVGFAALVLVDLANVLPTDVRIELPLGAAHAEARVLSIDVLDDAGESVRSVRLSFEEGAPATVARTLELPPGRYAVHVVAERADRTTWSLEGELEAPAEGTVRVPLRAAPR